MIVGFDNTLNLNNSANFWAINVIFFATGVVWPEILVLTRFALLAGRFIFKNANKSFFACTVRLSQRVFALES